MEMIQEKSWAEFRSTGLLLIINQLLHLFGWAITVELNEAGEIQRAFPARVRFRGFDEKSTSEAYIKVSEYMQKNAEELVKEARE